MDRCNDSPVLHLDQSSYALLTWSLLTEVLRSLSESAKEQHSLDALQDSHGILQSCAGCSALCAGSGVSSITWTQHNAAQK